MPFRLNKKNLAVTRVLPQGPESNKRLNYVYVSKAGSTATDSFRFARVTLPEVPTTHAVPVIVPKTMVNKFPALSGKESVELLDALPAVTTAEHAVPNLDMMLPEPGEQIANFTCNAEQLLTLLKVALDVSEDADKCIRLRICKSKRVGTSLRIDSLAFPGQQSFLGVLKEVQYDGKHIAGDIEGDLAQFKPADETVKQTPLPLVLSSGRKFRS